MATPPRCYLHIGVPKTGSTALQEFLWNNRDSLRVQGYLYPAATLRAHGHHDIAFLSSGGYPDWATPQTHTLDELIDGLRQEIRKTPHRVILSSENFYLLRSPQGVADLMARLGFDISVDVRVLVYLRRQDEAHLSWYNQAVKAQGFTGSIEQCIAATRDLWDYARELERWARVFGEANLMVRPYQKSDLPNGDIRLDFCRALHFTRDAFRFGDDMPNTGLNRSLLEFQRLLNALPASIQEKRRFHKQLIALSKASERSGLFDESSPLTRQAREHLLEQYAASNGEVARRFLRRETLFDTAMPLAHPHDGHPVNLTSPILTQIGGWLQMRDSASPST